MLLKSTALGGTQIEVQAGQLEAIRAVVAETARVDFGQAAARNAFPEDQAKRKVSSNNHVIREAPYHDKGRTSSGSPVMRQHGSAASC